MDKKKQLQAIEEYVYKHFLDDSTGHDYFHMKRVTRIAKEIAIKETADTFITESAAWLHDIGDPKLFSNPVRAIEDMYSFLESINIPREEILDIQAAMKEVSFSKGHSPWTLEGMIVQDADRIDAIGAIGIARTFAYGGDS